MNPHAALIDDQLAELRDMLRGADTHRREMFRPVVHTHCEKHAEGKLHGDGTIHAVYDQGPVTVVTFYISHRPTRAQLDEMFVKAGGVLRAKDTEPMEAIDERYKTAAASA